MRRLGVVPAFVPTINDLKRYRATPDSRFYHIRIPATDVVWCHLLFDCCKHYARQVGRV